MTRIHIKLDGVLPEQKHTQSVIIQPLKRLYNQYKAPNPLKYVKAWRLHLEGVEMVAPAPSELLNNVQIGCPISVPPGTTLVRRNSFVDGAARCLCHGAAGLGGQGTAGERTGAVAWDLARAHATGKASGPAPRPALSAARNRGNAAVRAHLRVQHEIGFAEEMGPRDFERPGSRADGPGLTRAWTGMGGSFCISWRLV